jgi:DNA helicase-2/ATP-dependent DNA helicase PcrA
VHLLTYHRAKGLEFEAVFLPRLERRELPWKLAKTDDEVAEERRLLYVGMTRAKTHLALTWSGRPSPFLAELGVRAAAPRAVPDVDDDDPLFASLKEWRRTRATKDGKPAYVVFHDATLAAIAASKPSSLAELGEISGVGPAKLERYGGDVLAVVGSA